MPIRDDQGCITRWFGINTDITERLHHEITLEKHSGKLAAANKEFDRQRGALEHGATIGAEGGEFVLRIGQFALPRVGSRRLPRQADAVQRSPGTAGPAW
ncbi:MAG: hypothetical protein ACOCXA_08735 [Planctomycetota bacterium]